MIAGMGVAGGVIAAGLADLPGIELACVEQVDRDDHASAGNGLNIGPLLAVPYARPTNDITALHGAKVAPALWGDMLIDQFDEMLRQSEHEPLVFNLSLHPFLVGHAFRLKHLRRAVMHIAARRERVWMARAGDIAAHVMALPGGTVA